MKYRNLSTMVLRGTYATLASLGVLSRQRADIAHELAIRAWVEALEERLDVPAACVWTERGGRS